MIPLPKHKIVSLRKQWWLATSVSGLLNFWGGRSVFPRSSFVRKQWNLASEGLLILLGIGKQMISGLMCVQYYLLRQSFILWNECASLSASHCPQQMSKRARLTHCSPSLCKHLLFSFWPESCLNKRRVNSSRLLPPDSWGRSLSPGLVALQASSRSEQWCLSLRDTYKRNKNGSKIMFYFILRARTEMFQHCHVVCFLVWTSIFLKTSLKVSKTNC